jgi:hypothetical protein
MENDEMPYGGSDSSNNPLMYPAGEPEGDSDPDGTIPQPFADAATNEANPLVQGSAADRDYRDDPNLDEAQFIQYADLDKNPLMNPTLVISTPLTLPEPGNCIGLDPAFRYVLVHRPNGEFYMLSPLGTINGIDPGQLDPDDLPGSVQRIVAEGVRL